MNERSAEYSKGKGSSDPLFVAVSLVSIAVIVAFERFYLRRLRATGEQE